MMEINAVLFYLSNVEVQLCQQQAIPCPLSQPVEVILSLIDIYKFREDLENEFKMDLKLKLRKQSAEIDDDEEE